jgi:hypothetical protein
LVARVAELPSCIEGVAKLVKKHLSISTFLQHPRVGRGVRQHALSRRGNELASTAVIDFEIA